LVKIRERVPEHCQGSDFLLSVWRK